MLFFPTCPSQTNEGDVRCSVDIVYFQRHTPTLARTPAPVKEHIVRTDFACTISRLVQFKPDSSLGTAALTHLASDAPTKSSSSNARARSRQRLSRVCHVRPVRVCVLGCVCVCLCVSALIHYFTTILERAYLTLRRDSENRAHTAALLARCLSVVAGSCVPESILWSCGVCVSVFLCVSYQ